MRAKRRAQSGSPRPVPAGRGVAALAAALLSAALAQPAASTAAAGLSPGLAVTPDPAARRLILRFSPEAVSFRGEPGSATVALDAAVNGATAGGPVIHLVLRVDDDFRAESCTIVARRETDLGRRALDLAPGEAAKLGGPAASVEAESWLRGRRLVHVTVRPLRLERASGRLVLAAELGLEIAGRSDPGRGLAPRSAPWEAKIEAMLAATTIDLRRNAAPGVDALLAAGGALPETSALWSPTFRPTTDGSAVEYVIVTTQAMAGAFQELAAWKTAKGVQTTVRTLEWIRATYPNGVDRAEQLRFFLADAYEHWGTLWVLLAGDSDQVPVRYATHALNMPPSLVPTDLYYSCLGGNWNADGDAAFGEGRPPGQTAGGDDADLAPDLFIGRAPVSTAEAAQIFVDKVIAYEQATLVSARYPASVLLLGERLSPTLDGAAYCEDVRSRLPAGLRIARLYENHAAYPGALPETRRVVIDSMNAGFGIVHHVGHGYRNTMSVGDEGLQNSDIDALVNGAHQCVVYAVNCASTAFDYNAIGERFLKNPDGGGVAYIGSSRVAFTGDSLPLQNSFYDVVFADSVTAAGAAHALAKVPFIGESVSETPARWLQFSLVLLGDPEMPIWRRGPAPITATHAGSFQLGGGTFTVTARAGGAPLAAARVALVKLGDPYAVQMTGANGVASFAFNPSTTGPFTVTVTRPDLAPATASAEVTPAAGPFLHFVQAALNDDATPPSSGNGNGAPEVGETLELRVMLKNVGNSTATGVAGTLSVVGDPSQIAITTATVSYGSLAPQGQSFGSGPFVARILPTAPDAYAPLFRIAIATAQGSFTDTFVLPVRRSLVEHASHVVTDPPPGGNGNGVPEAGEAITYTITAQNRGPGRADHVHVTLRVLDRTTGAPHPGVSVTDGSADFGDLGAGVTRAADPLTFTLGAGVAPGGIHLELTWRDVYGVIAIRRADLDPPLPVTGLDGHGSASHIVLTWSPPIGATDVRGYDVLRAPNAAGPFSRINSFTAAGATTYEDSGLPALTRFYYAVVARDSSFNASVPSAVISVTTTPPLASGWPIEMGQETSAGVVIDDLDGDGDLELVTGADAIYAWHADGTEVRDGDDRPNTSGVFTTDGQSAGFGYHATPAIADLTGDGDLELIAVAWTDAQVYVWNADGSREPGWPQSIGGDYNWASPAVADLDLDGHLEIIVASGYHGKIFAWHANGTEVADGDGNPATTGVLFATASAYLYSSPGIANIDADPYPEILVGTQTFDGKVYALRRDGHIVPGWPVLTRGPVTSSATFADLDRDGRNEVLFASESDSVFILRGDGSRYPGWPRPAFTNSAFGHTSSPVPADLDQDGNLDIVYAANDGRLHVWTRNGEAFAGFAAVRFAVEALNQDATQATPAIADVDGDGRLEILLGAENGQIYGWNDDGSELEGFPIAIEGEVRAGVGIWDLDRDGRVELVTASYDRQVYVWDLPGEVRGDRLPWPFFRHDGRNTGQFGVEITSIGLGEGDAPARPAVPILYPAMPNPFNPATTIRFYVPGESGGARQVRLRVLDPVGRVVRTLAAGFLGTGEQALRWDGRTDRGGRAASGAYFLDLEVGAERLTGKLILLK